MNERAFLKVIDTDLSSHLNYNYVRACTETKLTMGKD